MEFFVDDENDSVSIIPQDTGDRITLGRLVDAIRQKAEEHHIDESRLWLCDQVMDMNLAEQAATLKTRYYDNFADVAETCAADNSDRGVRELVKKLTAVQYMKNTELIIPTELPPDFCPPY